MSKVNQPRLARPRNYRDALKDFKHAIYREDLIKVINDKPEAIHLTKKQEALLMDMADTIEPGWHKKWDDKNPNKEQHWMYKLVRTKLFGLLK